jgi:hypothetical protein
MKTHGINPAMNRQLTLRRLALAASVLSALWLAGCGYRHLAVGRERALPARHPDGRPAARRLTSGAPVRRIAPRAHQQRHVVVLVGVRDSEVQRDRSRKGGSGSVHVAGGSTRHVEHQPVGASPSAGVVEQRPVRAAAVPFSTKRFTSVAASPSVVYSSTSMPPAGAVHRVEDVSAQAHGALSKVRLSGPRSVYTGFSGGLSCAFGSIMHGVLHHPRPSSTR